MVILSVVTLFNYLEDYTIDGKQLVPYTPKEVKITSNSQTRQTNLTRQLRP